jgi:chromosome segregation ATPase
VEHPKTSGTTLAAPEADEETAAAYRFTMILPAGRDLVLTVSEERPIEERLTLLALRPESFVSYAGNQEVPANVRAALQQAIELRRRISAAETAAGELENRRQYLISEQGRIRENFQAVGGETQPGQDYLKRLTALDAEIDSLAPRLEQARAGVKTAQKTYEDYLNGLAL